MKQVRLEVFGRVQGVFFRVSTQREAHRLNLLGWVKNRADRSVEIFAFGVQNDLEQLVSWCKKGPPLAQVDRVDEYWAELSQEEIQSIHSFDIIR